MAVLSVGVTEASADYRSTVLDDNPAAYFRLDETGNATTMVNQVSGVANGVHIESPVQGLPGALSFEDANLAIAYTSADTDNSQFPTPGGSSFTAFSIEFWMFTTDANLPSSVTQWYQGGGLVDAEVTGVSNDAGTALIRDGHVGFGMGNPDVTIESTTDVSDGQWHHVVATADGTGLMNLYVDGGLERTISNGPTGGRSNDTISIGELDTGNNPYNGGLDEVAFYRRVLTDAEVFEHYVTATTEPRQINVFVSEIAHAGSGRVVSDIGINCHLPNLTGDVCGVEVDEGTQVDLQAFADPGTRFSSWSSTSGCTLVSASVCRITADGTDGAGFEIIIPNFHLTGKSLARGLRSNTATNADRIEAAIDDAIQPRTQTDIRVPNVPALTAKALDFGDSGSSLAVVVPQNQLRLINAPTSSLLGSDGGTFKPLAFDPQRLLGSDGATLLGSDGATLLGSDGATLLGSGGGPRMAGGAAGCPSEFGRGGRAFVLGRYTRELDGLGDVNVKFRVTNDPDVIDGKDIINTFARMNLALKQQRAAQEALPATYLQAIQPEDEGRTGIAYDSVCVEK